MNDEWETPEDLFNTLDAQYSFEFDLCTNGADNSRCPKYTDDIVDHYLNSEHFNTYWMNPPYSRGNIGTCMKTAYRLSEEGATVVCLVRFDPSAKWFQEWVDGKASEVRMLDKRVKFRGAKDSYNFPCCIVVYDETELSYTELGQPESDYYIWGWK